MTRPSNREALAAAREDHEGEAGCEHDPRRVCDGCIEATLAEAIREIHAECDAKRLPDDEDTIAAPDDGREPF